MARLRTVAAESAGGIVFRHFGERIQLALCGRGDVGVWCLPKGTPAPGESTDLTAIRETREETGLDVRLVCPIRSIDYWFVARGTRFHKTVHFFLMEAVGGDVARHDDEHDEVRWFDLPDALAVLTYANEVDVAREAGEMVTSRSRGR